MVYKAGLMQQTYESCDGLEVLHIFGVLRPGLERGYLRRVLDAKELKKLTSTKLGTQNIMSLFVAMAALITLSGSGMVAGERGGNTDKTTPHEA